MNYIIEHIEYLTRRHDCVVLPSWGAFIAHYSPAFYDNATRIMYPPAREISFNTNIIHDDGLLSSSVARRETVSFEKASLMVSQEIESMKHQLKNDGEIVLGHIGRLVWQPESAPLFEPATETSSGMSPFFKPVAIEPVIEQARSAAEEKARYVCRRSRFSRLGRNFVRVAASVAVLVGVGLLLSTPMVSGRQDNLASFSTSASSGSSQTTLLPNVNSRSDLSLNIFIPKEPDQDPGKAVTAEPDKQSNADQLPAGLRLNSSDRYCLVIASLPNLSQAEKFIASSKESNLGLLEQDGKFRVYIATGKTSDDAYKQKQLGSIAEKYPDAWVCRRR